MAGLQHSCAFARLQEVAEAYAGAASRVWTPPYNTILGLPAARRHLAWMCITRIGKAPGLTREVFAEDCEFARSDVMLARWRPDAPRTVIKLLGKLEDYPWRPAEYRRLLHMVRPDAVELKALRHMAQISPLMLEALERLPAALRSPEVLRFIQTPWEAQLINDAVTLTGRGSRDPDAAGRRFVERLARSSNREQFFALALRSVKPDQLPVPIEETGRLRPLRSTYAVKSAARRFRNCLNSCVSRAMFERSAFLEWVGDEPAVMELVHDGALGWRLEELQGVGNQSLSKSTERAIHAALREHGVWIGPGAQDVVRGLERVVRTIRNSARQPRQARA